MDFCGIHLTTLCVVAIFLIAAYMIIQLIPFLAPFKNVINILFAAIVAVFIIVQVLTPLLNCSL